METSFSDCIAKIEKAESVKLNPEIVQSIREINRFFSRDDLKAYLLGQLLVDRSKGAIFEDPEMKGFLSQIEERGLTDYFRGRRRAVLNDDRFLNWIILGFGFVVMLLGVLRLLNSFIEVGLSNRYGILRVNEGGFPVVTGVSFIIIFFVRRRYSIRQKALFERLDSRSLKAA